jgi:pyruvate dehydrogenase E2 component (dihydrolipoamide acetyltransferase)
VIWGREDRILPASHSEGLPSSVKVTVLDAAGHLVHMEKAGEVNALIARFVS